ncbi:hypothetical protein JM83_3881 [Gillisia sp. Hel_I_86]|uniref:hypothetical protein n=1 Tax=Gillisia sp. Hel_I_86 TaxID=1249981 RepID=UPI00119BAB8C|nr:hypothetical protein [Gillisia sp. Hel_I_86]TVZ28732.1 hypothetical protein JM83_3881 [Gillisia sp. Hel_I_86]
MNTQTKNDSTLTLSKNQMRDYGPRVVDSIIEHFDTMWAKDLVTTTSSKERYEILPEAVPQEGSTGNEILDFVIRAKLHKNHISSYPNSFAFVPWTL